jgi:DNA-binding NarL/FixJ family response regulator
MRHQSTSDLIRVLVSDDSRVHTELLADALRRDGRLQVSTASSGSEGLIGRLGNNNIDVLLLSSSLDEQPGRGFEVLRGLGSLSCHPPAVMLLDSSKREMIVEAFRAGARGVFCKHESAEILSKCVRKVHEGQIWANSEQMATLVQALASSHHVRAVDVRGTNLLSKREMEIVRCVAEGLTNREIAGRLGLSPHTVKNCLFRVFDKLGASSRVELLFMTLSQDQHAASALQHLLKNQFDRNFLDGPTLIACQQAGEEGVLIAQLALAEFYSAHGTGPNDAIRAYMWWSIASEQMSRACREVTKGLTVDQLLKAEQFAADWLEKRVKVPAISDEKKSDNRLSA